MSTILLQNSFVFRCCFGPTAGFEVRVGGIVDVLYGLQKCQCENDGLHRSKPQSTSQETTCESLLRGQHILQELTRHRSCISRDLLGSAGRDDEPASIPASRPEIAQPIRRLDAVTLLP